MQIKNFNILNFKTNISKSQKKETFFLVYSQSVKFDLINTIII